MDSDVDAVREAARAAASRVRRLRAGTERSQDVYGLPTLPPGSPRSAFVEAGTAVKRRILNDERSLIDAALLALPDDGGQDPDPDWMRSVGFRDTEASRPKDGFRPDQMGGFNSHEWEYAAALVIGPDDEPEPTDPALLARRILETIKNPPPPRLRLYRWADRDEWWLIGRPTPLADPVDIELPSQPTRDHVRALCGGLRIPLTDGGR